MKLSDEVINSLSLNLKRKNQNIEKRKYRRDKT